MEILVVVILGLALLVWGVSSGMDSYASAKQAEAAIEAAKAAQAASTGTIVLTGLVIVLLVIVLALLAYIVIKPRLRRMFRPYGRGFPPGFGSYNQPRMSGFDPQAMLEMMAMYQWLQQQQRRQLPYQPPKFRERERYPTLPAEVVDDDPYPWP